MLLTDSSESVPSSARSSSWRLNMAFSLHLCAALLCSPFNDPDQAATCLPAEAQPAGQGQGSMPLVNSLICFAGGPF